MSFNLWNFQGILNFYVYDCFMGYNKPYFLTNFSKINKQFNFYCSLNSEISFSLVNRKIYVRYDGLLITINNIINKFNNAKICCVIHQSYFQKCINDKFINENLIIYMTSLKLYELLLMVYPECTYNIRSVVIQKILDLKKNHPNIIPLYLTIYGRVYEPDVYEELRVKRLI